ncbi:HIT domain-containing protein [Candidatus Pacearchaeota archaeon]|nr:HIT domain-containing protein [Candidatus Pacearchaeota archaeon]
MKRKCVFCRIIKGEIKGDVLRASNNFIALRDAKPAAEGHTLIIPKKHYVTLLDTEKTYLRTLCGFSPE